MSVGRVVKRVLIGRAERSDVGERALPKRIALPVFASDALSSVAYAADEIFLVLGLAGGSLALTQSLWVALAVAVVMAILVLAYRLNVVAYPSGGGDYEVVGTNLGPRAGLVVGSALLVDYVLTVAVSVSAGVQNASTAFGWLRGHEVMVAAAAILLLTLVNLRGLRESRRALALPTYLFIAAIAALVVTGAVRHFTGGLPAAESAALELVPADGYETVGMFAMAFLMLRAFSSGSAALTGIETISTGVPAFRSPKAKNAAVTLSIMGALGIAMLLSVVVLARWTGVQLAENPATQLLRDGVPVGEDHIQETLLGQISRAVFSGFDAGVILVSIVTGLILLVAANSAFNGFPALASILARDGFLPRQLYSRGDRLAFSNAILALAVAAVVFVLAFDASVTRLIQLYIVGVFVSFALSQIAMVRHWNRELIASQDPTARAGIGRRRVVNAVGATVSVLVLIIVLVTKFTHGVFLAVLAMAGLYVVMWLVRRHYDRVSRELVVIDDDTSLTRLPSRVHAVVLISKLNKPAVRALAYARATRPTTLEAVTVSVDQEATAELVAEWDRRGFDTPLKTLASPYRDVTGPVVDYVTSLRNQNPRELVAVYVPEYVVGRWYQNLLHNQNAARLKRRLHFESGVMVCSVPWQLRSAKGQEVWLDQAPPVTGSVRGPR